VVEHLAHKFKDLSSKLHYYKNCLYKHIHIYIYTIAVRHVHIKWFDMWEFLATRTFVKKKRSYLLSTNYIPDTSIINHNGNDIFMECVLCVRHILSSYI
jgi:hypothetical protein